MRVFKVWPGIDLNPCTERSIEARLSWLEESEPGDTIKIEVLEMTQAEFEALPEYEGP